MIEGNKKISVIVPVYNVERYLSKCLDSIINQTYKNLEIILVDDGSTDTSFALCDEYAQKDSRVTVIHKENSGVSSARNIGLDKATGDFIAFVDSDDYLEPNIYECLINKQSQENSDIVMCGYNIVTDNNSKRCIEVVRKAFCKTKDVSYILDRAAFVEYKKEYKNKGSIACYLFRMLFKKDILQNERFYEDVSIMEDTLFFLKVVLENKNLKIVDLEDCLYNYVMRENSAMHVRKNAATNSIKFIEKLETIIQDQEFIKHFKYFLYFDCSRLKLRGAIKESLQDLEAWNTKENYKCCLKHTIGYKEKLKMYLIRHKHYSLYKFLAKRL